MFRCAITGRVSRPGDKLIKIVVGTRPKTYKNELDEVIGTGSEIVKELGVSKEGLEKVRSIVKTINSKK